MRVQSSYLLGPTASTNASCGFSLAVSGRCMPVLVCVWSSSALSIPRCPSGWLLTYYNPRAKGVYGALPSSRWAPKGGSCMATAKRLFSYAAVLLLSMVISAVWQPFSAFQVDAQVGCQPFAQTGKAVCGKFWQY